MNLKIFELPYEKYILKGDRYKRGLDENTTLVLHGAGKSSRATFSRLRQYIYCRVLVFIFRFAKKELDLDWA